VVGVEAMVSVDGFDDFLPVKTSQTDITTCYEETTKMIEGRKLQRHKGRRLNRRAHEAIRRHDLVVSFQKVSLEFTKPNSSCRDGGGFSRLSKLLSLGLFAMTHKSFSTPLQLFYMK